MPLSVAVALVRHGDRLLLIRRERAPYVGWWALPGGKIEEGEHVAEAAVREVREETGLDAAFAGHRGVVSEHLFDGDALDGHFLLHVCALMASGTKTVASGEGELRWVNLGDALALERLLPSDRAMIDHFLLDGQTGYEECVMEKTTGENGDHYRLRSFG